MGSYFSILEFSDPLLAFGVSIRSISFGVIDKEDVGRRDVNDFTPIFPSQRELSNDVGR